jgi:hypothetical protein
MSHAFYGDDSLFSRIAGFGETFDWLAMSQRGTSGSQKSSLTWRGSACYAQRNRVRSPGLRRASRTKEADHRRPVR